MGQEQSTPSHHQKYFIQKNNHNNYNDDDAELLANNPLLQDLDKQIKEAKLKLYQTKVEGIMQRDQHGQEIYDLDIALYKRRTQLMHLGKSCQETYSFSDYIGVIQRTYSSRKVATRPVKSVFREDAENRPATTTDIVPQHFILSYTIFAWFEAYLLKRLHLAMLQRKQQSIHTKTWSGVVADMYFEIPAMKKKFEKKLGDLFLRKQNVEIEKHQKAGAYADHVRLQAKTIMKLEQASWERESEMSTSQRYTYATSANQQNIESSLKVEPDVVEKYQADATAGLSRSVASGRVRGRYSSDADSDLSGAEQELTDQINTLSASYHHEKGITDASRDEFRQPFSDESEAESDITYSGSDTTEEDGDRSKSVAVQKALNEAVEQQISTLPIAGDFDWQAGIEQELERERMETERDVARIEIEKMLVKHSAEDREHKRLSAEMENARLEADRMARRSKELKERHVLESAKLDMDRIETKRQQERLLAVAEKAHLTAERIDKEEAAQQSIEKERAQRADFKAQRLKDIQSRLSASDMAETKKSDSSSASHGRKQQRSQSLLATETRAREKLDALNRSVHSEDLQDDTEGSVSEEMDLTGDKESVVVTSGERTKAESLAEEKLESLRMLAQAGDMKVSRLERSPRSLEEADESKVIDYDEVASETEEQIRQRIRKEVLAESSKYKSVPQEESLEDSQAQIESFATALQNLRGSMTKLERLSFSQDHTASQNC